MTEPSGDPTIRFYAENATAYADHRADPGIRWLERFTSHLRAGAHVLELGCGNGCDSAWMIERGFDVMPTDGTPQMATEASRRLGREAGVLRFQDIDMEQAFDGIWASACLLHVPRSELPDILFRIHRALHSGGVFYASYKAGETEGLDSFGRYYNYPSQDWLAALYHQFAWSSCRIDCVLGGGYDGQPTEWLHVMAVKAI